MPQIGELVNETAPNTKQLASGLRRASRSLSRLGRKAAERQAVATTKAVSTPAPPKPKREPKPKRRWAWAWQDKDWYEGRPTTHIRTAGDVLANTRSEARALIKHELGIAANGRLPVGVKIREVEAGI